MYKITNIETLGTIYTVADKSGKLIKNVQIITHSEILEAAMGEYNETMSIASYLDKSIALLEGNEDINQYNIYWHSSDTTDIDLTEIIDYCITHRYDTVIIEYLEPLTQ